MTLVTVDLRRPCADGEHVAVRGAVEWTPTRRRATDGHVVLPQPFRHEASAPVTVDVAPTGPDWCWQVKELTSTGITRHVMVPDVPGPVAYTALTDVDPATLDPVAEPEAAWWGALVDYSDAATAARDDAVAAAAGAAGSAATAGLSASAAAASEGLAEGHASDASGSAGAAASSASAASGSAVAAAGSEGAAAGHATDAQSALDLTVVARDLTLGYRDTASTAATTATEQAGLATTARTGAETARAQAEALVAEVSAGAPRLLGRYVHSGNLVAQPTAVDMETGVFTCVNHGLDTGNLVRPRFNGGFGNASLQDALPGGLPPTGILTVTVLTPDTFTVGPTQFTSEGELSVWAFERYVTASVASHRVTLPEPMSSYRVVAYGIDGTRYIKADTEAGGTNAWTPGGIVTDRYGSLALHVNTEVGFFCEYTARNIGGLQALYGLKVKINANGVLTQEGPALALSRIAQPLAVTWVAFNNGRMYNGNTLEVWDR